LRTPLLVYGLAILLCLIAGRLQSPVQTNGSQLAVTERGKFVWGPEVTLNPGDYRSSLTMSLRKDSKTDPSDPAAVIGFTPLGDGWSPGVKELRLLDLAGNDSRTYLVPFHQDTVGRRAWSWRYYAPDTALVQQSSVVWRERSLLELVSGGATGSKSAAAITIRMVLALLVLAFTTLMGTRVFESRFAARPWHLTILGLVGYVLSAIILVAAEAAIFPGSPAPDRI